MSVGCEGVVVGVVVLCVVVLCSIACAVNRAATIAGSMSGVSYVHPEIGQLTTGMMKLTRICKQVDQMKMNRQK